MHGTDQAKNVAPNLNPAKNLAPILKTATEIAYDLCAANGDDIHFVEREALSDKFRSSTPKEGKPFYLDFLVQQGIITPAIKNYALLLQSLEVLKFSYKIIDGLHTTGIAFIAAQGRGPDPLKPHWGNNDTVNPLTPEAQLSPGDGAAAAANSIKLIAQIANEHPQLLKDDNNYKIVTEAYSAADHLVRFIFTRHYSSSIIIPDDYRNNLNFTFNLDNTDELIEKIELGLRLAATSHIAFREQLNKYINFRINGELKAFIRHEQSLNEQEYKTLSCSIG